MSVNPFERCVDTDWACRLDRIAQGDQLHYSRVLLQGDEGVEVSTFPVLLRRHRNTGKVLELDLETSL